MYKTLLLTLILGLFYCSSETTHYPGEKSTYNSFNRYDFKYNGRECTIVEPHKAAKGKPWIWRARFFGHAPQTEIALLEKGFHVAYIDVSNLFGSPRAVAIWDDYYNYLVNEFNFDKKTVLEGLSRGGLIIYNWAAKNPDKIHCIYADAPVCDIKSWPKGKGTVKPQNWLLLLEEYGMTEQQAIEAKCNPIDNLAPLADAKIPLIHVVGDDDKTVPVSENTAILEQRYKELGGEIKVIHKEGIGHHPHGLEDPTPIVDFILEHMKN